MSELFTYGEVGGVGGNSGPYPDLTACAGLGRRSMFVVPFVCDEHLRGTHACV